MEYFDAPNHSVEHMTIQFTDDAISKICSMDDFYNATGLADVIKELGVTNVDQIWMNRTKCEGLQDIVMGNLKKSKKYKNRGDRALNTAVAMDWLNYSPVSIPYIPDNEIWIFAKDDARIALEEYRDWNARSMMHDD